jgi:hypothetical protein
MASGVVVRMIRSPLGGGIRATLGSARARLGKSCGAEEMSRRAKVAAGNGGARNAGGSQL